ncbi:MAG: NERD domain-containing protein [Salinibacterium sp.]|nr:NERD domain-containing protein [Salinibacterium sp.]
MAEQDRAGASARREYERRRANDEARLRREWGRLGGVAVALSAEKQSTKAWSTGAVGEERVGAVLDRLASDSCHVLHDRRIPGSKANIDHLVVNASGVWVIDAKRYAGKPERRVEGGLFRPRVQKLFIRGRDKTSLAEGVKWQVSKVREALPNVPVVGFLCFVDAEWGLLDASFLIDDVTITWPRKLASMIKHSKALDVDPIATATALAAVFRAA